MISLKIQTVSGVHLIPVVMYMKKNTKQMCFCCDFRAIIKASKPKFFPSSRLEDVFDSIDKENATTFSSLDLFSDIGQ